MKQELISKIQSKYEIKRILNKHGFIIKPVLPHRKKLTISYNESGYEISPVEHKNFVSTDIIRQIRGMIPVVIKEFHIHLDIIPTTYKHRRNKIVAFNCISFDKVKYPDFNSLDVLLMIKEYLPELNPMCSHIDCENNLMLVPFFAINSGTIETVHHRCEKLKNLYNASSVSVQLISPDDYGLECETNYYLLNYYERELKNISLVDIRSTN